MKRCPKCKTEKSLTEFHRDASTSEGVCCWCKVCQADANRKRLLRYPEWQRGIVKRSDLKRKYGMTPESKAALIASQNGCCACCGDLLTSDFNSHIDHLHNAKPVVIRGILCPQCNVGLGNFKDSPERLLKAVAYLKKFQKSP